YFFCLVICRFLTSTLFPYTTLFRSSHIFVIIEHLPQFGIIGVDAEVVLLAVFELAMSFITNNRNLRNLIARGSARIVDIVYLSRSEEHTSELQSRENLVCRLLLEKK